MINGGRSRKDGIIRTCFDNIRESVSIGIILEFLLVDERLKTVVVENRSRDRSREL